MLVITQKSNAVKIYFDCFSDSDAPVSPCQFCEGHTVHPWGKDWMYVKMPHAERPSRDSYVRLSVKILQIL
jgi:hypothetical protein